MKLITINSRIFSAKPAIVGSFLNKNLNFSPGWGRYRGGDFSFILNQK